MKDAVKKYLFEIVVIFIGITISFFFDGWRKDREQNQKIAAELISVNLDLDRIKGAISNADSSYHETLLLIARLRTDGGLNEQDLVSLFWKISEDPMDYQVQGLSPYLSQSSNSDLLNYFFEKDQIITLVAYINKLILMEYECSKSISDYTTQTLWSKIDNEDLLSKVIKVDHVTRWADSAFVDPQKRYSIKMFKGLNSDLYLVESKINRLLQIHQALNRKIDRLKEALRKI